MKKINAANYRKDKLYPAVARSVSEILQTSNMVSPIELLLRLRRITKQQYEDWRFGRIAYLERVCAGNLGKLSRTLRILDQHARALGLKPSQTAYRKWGRGGKRIILRFSKSGDKNLEAAYSRCYIANNRPATSRPKVWPADLQNGVSHGEDVQQIQIAGMEQTARRAGSAGGAG